MRYVYSAAATAAALLILATTAAFGQGGTNNLSVVSSGYVETGEQRIDRTHWDVTFTAVLQNTGPALSGVTATIISLAPNVQVVAGQGTVHFSPVPAGTTAAPVRVTSSDSFTILVDRSVTFDWSQVQWSLQYPFANPGPNQTVAVGGTVTLNGSGSTNTGSISPLTYSWAVVAPLPAGSKAVLVNANAMIATFVADVPGTYNVQLTVSNGSASDSAAVKISTANSPPVANAGPNQTVQLGATVTLDGTGSSDVDGDPLTYLWTMLSAPPTSLATIFNSRSAKAGFVMDVGGTYKAQLVVNDGTYNSQPSVVTITTGNTPPIAVASCSRCSGSNGTSIVNGIVQLDGSKSTDVNGDALTYQWSLNTTQAPGSKATISDPTLVNPTFTADVSGTYVAQLVVSDGQSQSAAATVTITTTAVLAPSANAGPNQTVHAGSTVYLSGSGTDPQNLTLTYSWSLITRPAGSSASLSSGNIANPTFVADLPGTYAAQLVVNNGFLSSNPSAPLATVTITTTDTPPAASPRITNQGGTVFVGNTVFLDGGASSDPDSDPITGYAWSLSSAPPRSRATLNNAATMDPTFVADVAGTYVVQLIVTDPFASSAPVTLSINAGTPGISMSVPGNPSASFYSNTSATMVVTLSPPAGSTPVTVQLGGYDTSALDLPNFVTIPANSSSANVTLNALALTDRLSVTTTVTATASGYSAGNLTVTITTPGISLALAGNATSIGLGNSIGGTVTLGAPAPTGGTVVTLAYNSAPDGSIAFDSNGAITTTVSIPAGGTTGSFKIYGTAIGTSTIIATGSGYSRATLSVQVIASVSFSTQAVSVGAGGVKSFGVLLSAPAPTGGLSIKFTSDSPSVATVDPSDNPLLVPGGATTASANVNGLTNGSANITASVDTTRPGGQNFSAAGASLSVIVGGIAITTPSLPAGTAGAAYPSTTLAAGGGTGTGYTWSVSAGSLPTGLNLSSGGVLSGTLSSSATTSTFTIQVQDSSSAKATKQFTITVNPALNITTASLPGGSPGAAYTSTTLTASGGTGTGYTWSVSAGSLPTGLNLSSGGVLSGTLSNSATTATFTIQVQDSGGTTATKQFTITVSGTLSITTASLPAGTPGAAYTSTTLTAGGGTGTGYTWSVSAGSLPTGLNLSSSGVLSGTLSNSATTTTFTIQVQDSGGTTATKQFTITVNGPVSITTASLPAGTPGAAYTSTTLTASGGTGTGYTWSVSAGSLPTGLNLSSGGVLSGTLSNSATTATFTIQVQDSGGTTATKQFTITVNSAVTISAASLPAATPGTPYTATTLSATGGTGTGYTWTITAGSLPAGLNLSTGGVLSGTPTSSAVTSTFTVQAQDSGGNAATRQFTISVVLTIVTDALPGGTAGAPYTTTTLAAAGGNGQNYTWSLSSGRLVSGLSLSAGGVISGSLPIGANTFTFNVQVQDSAGNVATKQFTITVNTQLTIDTASLPTGTAGSAYTSTKLIASGGTGTGYTWTVTAGSLPNGLSLSSAGTLSGTLSTSAVSSTFTVQVQDSGGAQTTKQLTITVNSALSITTASLPAGTLGVAYPSTTLAATGGTSSGYSWAVIVGALPSGLNLSSAGVLSGTLSSSATTATFTIQVTDSGNNTATKQFTITVSGALSIVTASLPAGTQGSAYPSTTLSASGGTGTGYTWSVSTGSLPAGLNLSSAGVLSGTVSSSATTATFTIQVKDSGSNITTRQFTITVNPPVSITTASLPAGTAAAAYPSTTLAATGGTGTGYAWSVSTGSLPTGLNLSTAGVLSGTLSSSATTATFTIQVQDNGGNTATKQFTITVNPAVTVTTASLPTGTAGQPYTSTTLTASGGSGTGYTWSVSAGSLPAGLNLSTAGVLSGTLSVSAVNSTFTIQVQDSGGATGTKQFTITVNGPLTIVTASLPTGTAGQPYTSTTLTASGGSGTGYTWSVSTGSLPTGLNLSSAGVLSGTLSSSAATSTFSIQVQDSIGGTASKQFTLTVSPALGISTNSLPGGGAGSAYPSTTLSATGGTGTGYTWSVSAGSLPTGLNLSSAGVLSGTLSSSATTATFTIQVKDSGGTTVTRQFTISILTITTPSLPGGSSSQSYTASLNASGGTLTYTWSAGGQPSGITMNPATGVLSGTPRANGTYTVTITVTDSSAPALTAQAVYSLVISSAPLAFGTSATLPNAVLTVPPAPPTVYSTQIVVTGGTPPYNWTPTGLPTWLTFDPIGNVCGAVNSVCGTPTGIGTFTFTIGVTDSSVPALSISQQFSVMVTFPGGQGTITITQGTGNSSSVTVGQGLEVPITITFSPAPLTGLTLNLSSDNPNAVVLGNAAVPGTGVVRTAIDPGTTSVVTYAQAVGASAGPIRITASVGSAYVDGTATVTIGNSGFVLSGPSGVGGSFIAYQSTTTPVTVYSALLDSSNMFVEAEQVAPGLSFTGTVGVVPSTLGSVSPTSATITGGSNSASVNFTASSTNSGAASMTLTQPPQYINPATGATVTFTSPAVGNSLNITVQSTTFVAPAGIIVGQNLQTTTQIGLTGPAPTNMTVTITSLDPAHLKFALNSTDPGSTSITRPINQNHTATPPFYVFGYGNSGSVQYTISAPGFGTVTSSIAMGPSGLGISAGPLAALGAGFTITTGSGDASLYVWPVLLNGDGTVNTKQAVAGDQSISATVTSGTPATGTVTTSSIVIAGGAANNTTGFHPLANGTSTITASATGYGSGTIQANVTNARLFFQYSGLTVGQYLEQQNTVILSSPAGSGGVQVTLTSNSPLLQLAQNATDKGSNSIVVTVPQNGNSATFWIYGEGSSGAPTYTGTATNYGQATDTVSLTPSGVVILGPNGFPGSGNVSLAGGPVSMTVYTYQLSTDGKNTPSAPQPLAGKVDLMVPLTSSDVGVGMVPGSATIKAGASSGSFTFTPVAAGRTTVSVTQPQATSDWPNGWTASGLYGGIYNLNQFVATVQ